MEAAREDDTGPRISAVAVESNAANLHLICESPLFKKDRAIVPPEALRCKLTTWPMRGDGGLASYHRRTGCSAYLCTAKRACSHHRLCGQCRSDSGAFAIGWSSPSLTEPGVAPTPSSWLGGSLAPTRRSLEQRGRSVLTLQPSHQQVSWNVCRPFG